MAVPCRRDLACFRNDGHPGDCAYPTPETTPIPMALGEVDMPKLAQALRNAKPCGDPNCADRHLIRALADDLDVERLVGALAAVDHRIAVEFPEEAEEMESHAAALGRRSYGEAVAAEYARLARSDSEAKP